MKGNPLKHPAGNSAGLTTHYGWQNRLGDPQHRPADRTDGDSVLPIVL